MMTPERTYQRRRLAFERLMERQRLWESRLSNLRLATVALGLAAAIIAYRTHSLAAAFAVGAVALALFIYLALRHAAVASQLRCSSTLSVINRQGAERTAGQWTAFADAGAEFRDDEHPYASDLDLFGQASVFQWINSAQTALGRHVLAQFLTQPPPERTEILARQEAVTELAQKLSWRQRFEAEGRLVADQFEPTEPLLHWAGESHDLYLRPAVKAGVRVMPAITLAVGLLCLLGALPWQVPVLFIAVQILLLRADGKERSRILTAVYRQERQLRVYAAMLERFEEFRFTAPWLRERQARLRSAAGEPAYQQVRQLSRLADRISSRQNAIFIIVNVLLLWDYQCMIALEEWKRESGRLLKSWLTTLAEIEAASSLAHIRFENPDWAMPTFVEGEEVGVAAREMGHPLIAQGRVCNDFDLRAPAHISVITGSNMSGKSTFLRTVGLNLVLAYAGAPVCAAEFRCSRMRVWTCMRIADNLEKSISSFYAEILRIKQIVEAARGKERVFFLLDEIFKGTNSFDRHQGAKALIGQLERAGAYGLISTHDLELGELERESQGRIVNYHFREYYQDGQIRFDYKLRPGVSTTRNALYLIKMAGIELEEDGA